MLYRKITFLSFLYIKHEIVVVSIITALFLFCTTVPGYFVLNLDIAFNLGFLTFTSWRLLIFIMGLPLGIAGIWLVFFCESPKFLMSLGRKEEALKTLSRIHKLNGGIGEYPVC